MKKLQTLITIMLLAWMMPAQAQTARQVLDKAAANVNRKGGASANFSITSGKHGGTRGTIAIKGAKFRATTPEAIVWYNGKTQWTYMKKTEEVNVSTPSQSQQASMNPYLFITMYKKGYNLSMTKSKGNYEVHMKAQNASRSVQEMYITVNSKFLPTRVKMKHGKEWMTINITNFQAKNQSDAIFQFNSKDFPSAEVIDLR